MYYQINNEEASHIDRYGFKFDKNKKERYYILKLY